MCIWWTGDKYRYLWSEYESGGQFFGYQGCWVSFTATINMVSGFNEKLGIHPPWRVVSSLALGWPAFRQEGIVPREFKPVTWFRPGAEGPVEETEEGFETVKT